MDVAAIPFGVSLVLGDLVRHNPKRYEPTEIEEDARLLADGDIVEDELGGVHVRGVSQGVLSLPSVEQRYVPLRSSSVTAGCYLQAIEVALTEEIARQKVERILDTWVDDELGQLRRDEG